MSTKQEYWDACLIRSWRNFNAMWQLNQMFHSITGEWAEDIKPRLLRTPKQWFPNTMQTRYYVAHFLPKINERLLNQDPDKDVALLRKLKDSKYDTDTVFVKSESEREKKKAGEIKSIDQKINAHNIKVIASRNQETDWNKVKGGRVRRVR